MFTVIVIPSNLAPDSYTEIVPIKHIRPFGLISVEDNLDQLISTGCVVFKDIFKRISNDQIFKKKDIFTILPNQNECYTESFQALAEYIETQLERIASALEIHTRVPNEPLSEPEDTLFLDNFYCTIDRKMNKKFEKLFDPKTLLKIKNTENETFYRVYCLKNERDLLINRLQDTFGSCIQITDREMPVLVQDMEKLGELLKQCLRVIKTAAVYRGLAESINKCGVGDFKYMIIQEGKEEKELKALKAKFKNIDDIVSVVKIGDLEDSKGKST